MPMCLTRPSTLSLSLSVLLCHFLSACFRFFFRDYKNEPSPRTKPLRKQTPAACTTVNSMPQEHKHKGTASLPSSHGRATRSPVHIAVKGRPCESVFPNGLWSSCTSCRGHIASSPGSEPLGEGQPSGPTDRPDKNVPTEE